MLIALTAAGAAELAPAQTREDMLICREIKDETRRLACYDAIYVLPGVRSKYETVDIGELKSFALSYRGQLVEVSGWVKPGARTFSLGLDDDDRRPLPLDLDQLARRDRQAFLDTCGEGCEATVQGTVRPVNFTTGIVADTIVIR